MPRAQRHEASPGKGEQHDGTARSDEATAASPEAVPAAEAAHTSTGQEAASPAPADTASSAAGPDGAGEASYGATPEAAPEGDGDLDDDSDLTNYANRKDGAKLLFANPEAKKADRVLGEEDYNFMKNDCKADKWLAFELTQRIQVRGLQLTQLELYSSRVRAFTVYGASSKPPKGDAPARAPWEGPAWVRLADLEAANAKGVQDFRIDSNAWSRFLLVHFRTHYGSQPVCTINTIKVFGRTEAEELEAQLSALQDEMEREEAVERAPDEALGFPSSDSDLQSHCVGDACNGGNGVASDPVDAARSGEKDSEPSAASAPVPAFSELPCPSHVPPAAVEDITRGAGDAAVAAAKSAASQAPTEGSGAAGSRHEPTPPSRPPPAAPAQPVMPPGPPTVASSSSAPSPPRPHSQERDQGSGQSRADPAPATSAHHESNDGTSASADPPAHGNLSQSGPPFDAAQSKDGLPLADEHSRALGSEANRLHTPDVHVRGDVRPSGSGGQTSTSEVQGAGVKSDPAMKPSEQQAAQDGAERAPQEPSPGTSAPSHDAEPTGRGRNGLGDAEQRSQGRNAAGEAPIRNDGASAEGLELSHQDGAYTAGGSTPPPTSAPEGAGKHAEPGADAGSSGPKLGNLANNAKHGSVYDTIKKELVSLRVDHGGLAKSVKALQASHNELQAACHDRAASVSVAHSEVLQALQAELHVLKSRQHELSEAWSSTQSQVGLRVLVLTAGVLAGVTGVSLVLAIVFVRRNTALVTAQSEQLSALRTRVAALHRQLRSINNSNGGSTLGPPLAPSHTCLPISTSLPSRSTSHTSLHDSISRKTVPLAPSNGRRRGGCPVCNGQRHISECQREGCLGANAASASEGGGLDGLCDRTPAACTCLRRGYLSSIHGIGAHNGSLPKRRGSLRRLSHGHVEGPLHLIRDGSSHSDLLRCSASQSDLQHRNTTCRSTFAGSSDDAISEAVLHEL